MTRSFGSLYLVSGQTVGSRPLASLVPDLVAAGVDLIQLREKDMEALDLMRAAEPIAEACRSAKVPFILNDRPDVALAIGVDGVHLGQGDLPVEIARRVLGEGPIVGRSTHTPGEVDGEAKRPGIDYIAVGPVTETPTKPGRPAAGIGLIEHAAQAERAGRLRLPWFAIGGVDRSNLERVMAAGARRIVVVRAITEAPDPPAAAGRLKEILER